MTLKDFLNTLNFENVNKVIVQAEKTTQVFTENDINTESTFMEKVVKEHKYEIIDNKIHIKIKVQDREFKNEFLY